MRYRFSKGLERNSLIFSQNLLDPRSYFVPFSCREVCEKADYVRSRFVSDRITVLDGEWDFWYFDRTPKKSVFDTDMPGKTSIKVPLSWENAGLEERRYFAGYAFETRGSGVPDGKNSRNTLGVYRKSVGLYDLAKNYTLTFLRVHGALEVHVNGRYVGASALGSGEFDITKYLVPGQNEIVAAVKRWTKASYLEGEGGFSVSGITGSVYITAQNPNCLYDFDFSSAKEGDEYVGKFRLAFNTDGNEAKMKISLELDGKRLRFLEEPITDRVKEFSLRDEFAPYTCETPVLYDLYVTTCDSKHVTECTRFRIGFYDLQNSDGQVLYCGRPLAVKGVNYNAVYNKEGGDLTLSDCREDFRLLKRYNFNTIQPTHVLDPAAVLSAAETGLYFIDRIAVDTSAVSVRTTKRNCVAGDAKFSAGVRGRTKYSYNRDKYMPGILAFGLGSENSAACNIAESLEYLRERTDLPLIYRESDKNPGTGFYTVYNPTLDGLVAAVNKVSARRPVYMSEYALASGIGCAYLEEIDNYVEDTPCCVGGSVAYFVDEISRGEGYSDCGLFNEKREPYAGALNHRYVARHIKASLAPDDKLELFNADYFASSDADVALRLIKDGREITGIIVRPAIKPRTAKRFDVFLGNGGGDAYLNVEYLDEKGEVAVREQKPVSQKLQTVDVFPGRKVSVDDRFDCVTVIFDNGSVRFSKVTGTIIGYNVMGKEILYPAPVKSGGACFNVKMERPFVHNILDGGYGKFGYELSDFKVEPEKDRVGVAVTTSVRCGNKIRYAVQDQYYVRANGEIESFSYLTPYKRCPEYLQCFGKQLRLRDRFDKIVYYGRGEGDNYIDLCNHAVMGIYASTADKMSASCAFGQECGNRTDCHYVTVRDREGDGIIITALNEPFNLRVGRNSDFELAESYLSKTPPEPDGVYVDIASVVGGIGVGNHGMPLPKYLVKSAEMNLHFKILPLYKEKEGDFISAAE